MGQTPCGVHVGPVATSSGTHMISLMARCALAALVSALGWSGSMFAVGVDILHSTFKCKFAETANWKQATTEFKQQLWRGASRPTQSIMYVPLRVNRFQKSISLMVKYKYLKSCSGDFYSPESDPPHKIMRYWFYYSI